MDIKKQFQGMGVHRFEREPLEKRFAEAWQNQNSNPRGPGLVRATLAYLMDERNRGEPKPPLTDRDWLISSTIFQWLGSTVGQSVLVDVLSLPEAQSFRERLAIAMEGKK